MKSRKIWKTVLIALGCALGAWAFGALLLPVLLPFFIGLAVSLLAEKPVRLLQTRAHVPRSLASGLCVLLLFGLLFGGLFFLCRLLCAEAADLARQLPRLAENLAPLFEKLKSRLLALAERLPDGLGTGLRAGVEEFFKTGAGFGTKLYETLFSWASGIIGRLPDAVLFAVTAILSSFMLSGELPAIRGWLRRTVRPAWLEKLQTLGGHVRTTLGGWLRAQLKLMGITFLILNAGLLLLRVRYPVLAALVITVVDALPVFGTGTILIPWALALFLQGETKTGIGLVILYGAAALSRQALEPRLVGKQVGLNPVLTLLALYTGYRLLLLRVRYPVLAALVITVVDALPVFGTGTILIPWALALFLQGETKTGIGLVILYGAAALSRQALEPRLVGKQVGLNPVLTLLALYTGYRLLGVGGMIVFPIAAMLFKQLWDHSGLQPDG